MMQTNDAIILKKNIWYLDPLAICEARHVGPKWMKDNDDYLKPFETKKEKDEPRNKFHKDTMKRVASYIALMMETWVDMGCIFAQYHVQ